MLGTIGLAFIGQDGAAGRFGHTGGKLLISDYQIMTVFGLLVQAIVKPKLISDLLFP